MFPFLMRKRSCLLSVAAIAVVTGCAVPVPPAEPDTQAQTPPACTPVSESDELFGSWLAVRSQKGVAGELRTLFTLQNDGTMAYTEQLKRPRQPSQGLSETGCWHREGQNLVLRTYESNGSMVEVNDPIYTNRYAIVSVDENMLRLKTADDVQLTARKMSPGYRLPF